MSSKKDLNEKYISFLEQTKDDTHKAVNHLNDRVLIVDGLNTFIRSFAVNPALNEDGLHIGGMVGFMKSVRYTCDILKPSRCIIVFDGKGGSKRRRKIFPEYKGTRKVKRRLNRNVDWGTAPADEQQSMKQQMGRLIEYLEQLPLTLVSVDGIEADDTMAYISQQLLPKSDCILMSTDKDFLQLVDDRIQVYSPTKKLMYDEERIKNEFGINPKNFLLYRVLDGDKSDGIPGVHGVGLKTLLKNFPWLSEDVKYTINDLLKSASKKRKQVKLCENICNSEEQMLMNRRLMDLDDGIMGGSSKLKVQNITSQPIQRMIKHKFQKMFLEDKMYTALPNLTSWLATTFNRLNHMAEKTHG